MHRKSREDRFSARVLQNYAATKLPEAFSFRAAADGVTEILIYDEIGYWGVTAKDFVMALAQVGDGPINVRINSPGGDVFDGMAIYNALKARTAPVTVTIDGLAASAASYIAMAGSEIVMGELSMLMIHNAWGLVIGNRHDMLDSAATMEKIDGLLAGVYAARCGMTPAECAALMDAETWFTAQEAIDAKLGDSMVTKPAASAPALANARPLARAGVTAKLKAALPAYDPDGDGDNDAEGARAMVNAAMVLLTQAAGCLAGTNDDDTTETVDPAATTPAPVIDPGMASRARRLRLVEAEAA